MLKKFKTYLPFYRNNRNNYHEKYVTIGEESYFVRQMLTSDIKELISVERIVYKGSIPWTKSAFISELYSKYTHQYLCILFEDQIIGFIGIRLKLGDGHITNVATLPEYQGRGIGSFLIKEVEKFAKKNRCKSLSLEVRISNRDAQRLYRQFGFESRRILPAYYNEGNEDAVDMVKYLK
jgi:ribosomal-protein-alanine N-acetyltransferase